MTADQLAQKAQNFLNRGRQALESGKFDLAIDMLLESLKAAPSVLEARRLLRAAQIRRFQSNPPSSIQLKLQGISNWSARQKILGLCKKGEGAAAMEAAEQLLCKNPLDPDNIECAVKAAETAQMPEAAAISIEAAYSCNGNDENLLERIANYYLAGGNFLKARDAYEKLSKLRPHDQRIQQKLKDSEARATMSQGWDQSAGQKGGYRNLIANKDQAAKLDAANKAVVTDSDADTLIAEKKAQIEKEPNNMNYYRALARLYSQNKRFPEAIETLEAAQKVNSADPELDRMLSTVRTAYFEFTIEQLKAEGRMEDAEQVELEKNQFVFEDLAARVERYPNDLHLRFELGEQYYMYGEQDPSFYDEAIQHLQLAQKSPKDRLEALYLLALCFLAKGQRDMAVMQLETARDQLPQMNELKKKIVYQLGLCAEEAGDIEKAYAYYKDVYSNDVTFADINERMLAISKAIQERKQA